MSNMLEEIHAIPGLIASQFPVLDSQIRQTFTHRDLLQIKEIVLCGCGDSLFASYGTRHFFQRICNLPARALPSMEASRYDLLDYQSPFPQNPFVIATSVSGEVARTVEVVEIAKSKGAATLAITSDSKSRLASTAWKVVHYEMPPLKRSPGVLTFRASLLAMYLFGIHLAEVRGRLSPKAAEQLRSELKETGPLVQQTILRNEAEARQLADILKGNKYFVFIGDGPNLASATFSAAKIIEAAGLPAVGQNTEEWAHLQYFETEPLDIPTFVITGHDRGYSRVLELLEPLKRTGRTIIAIAPKECSELHSAANHSFPLAKIPDIYAPMVFPVVCELFAAYLCETIGSTYYREDLRSYPRGANTVRSSSVLSKDEILQNA